MKIPIASPASEGLAVAMEIELETLAPIDCYRLLTHVVVPRPIAWVTTLNENGSVNAAPFSFFNTFGSKPPLLVLGIGNRPDSGEPKDTVLNIRRSGEFVVNTVSREQAELMVASAATLPHGESETERFEIKTAPSRKIGPPRIANSAASLECRLHSIQEIGQNRLIIAQVVHASIQDERYDSVSGKIDTRGMHLVGRMHGSAGYADCEGYFEIERPG